MASRIKVLKQKEGSHPTITKKTQTPADFKTKSPSAALGQYHYAVGNQAMIRLLESGAVPQKIRTGFLTSRNEPIIQWPINKLMKFGQHGFLRRQIDEEEETPVQARRIDVNSFTMIKPGIQKDLARVPPGRVGTYTPLTDAEVQAAIDYNTQRYSTRRIRHIQDIVGATVTGTMNEETIHMICEWQADFRLTVDGKVGLFTLRTIVLEMIAEGLRNAAIWMIIDGHNMPTLGLISIRYDPTLVGSNAVTSGPIPGDSRVRIGPNGFNQGYAGLVHTIAHELEHVRQRRAGILNQNVREFLAEAVEIISHGMFLESMAGMMDDARRALHHWNLMPAADQAANWGRFQQVRNEVRRRFNAASAATQATHQATMNAYNAVAAPPGAGP